MSDMILFVVNSIMLGFGLAMDAFSVSLANGFLEPGMKKKRMAFMAGIYAFFQCVMPLIGWFLVRNAANFFEGFRAFIPWIALVLLCYIGGKMLIEGIQDKKCTEDGNCLDCPNRECRRNGEEPDKDSLTLKVLTMQGIATSIDALSVGFTIADYNALMALACGIIIASVTFITCYFGIGLGKKFGTKLAGNAKILGGIVLIAIGIEILAKSFI